MESTLFWISGGLFGYAVLLRQLFKRPHYLNRRALGIFLHFLFWTAAGVMTGCVISASTDLHGMSPRWPVICGIVGFFKALLQVITLKKEKSETTGLLIGDLEWAETSYSAILLASVIMYAVVQAFKIPSGSMERTLLIGDHLFVNKFIYGIRVPFTQHRIVKLRDVHHREIIVFEAPQSAILAPDERERGVHKDFIKRAIGLPGDTIEIRNKQVYVNGKPQDEPYAVRDGYNYPAAHLDISPQEYQNWWETGRFATLRREEIGDNFGPIKVPPNCYFVMGDNRDYSFDSRFWGPMPNRLLKGKAWVVYWPPSRVRVIR